tara:strand:+ start:99 stop:698 length:600 start_codon:yes stop_codon:yes gene_type:complete
MSYTSVRALLNKGISRPTLFRVEIPKFFDSNVDRNLDFLCKAASVPEVAVATMTANGQENLGVVREQPTFTTYAKPFSITVVSDRDYTVYKAMRAWFDTSIANSNPFVLGSLGSATQRVQYYDTYPRTIQLTKLEQNGLGSYFSPFKVIFNKAYPIRIGQLGLDTEAYDQRMDFNIDFTYETYTLNNFRSFEPADPLFF